MRRRPRRLRPWVLALVASLGLTGCGVEPALIGAVAGAANTGSVVFQSGKIKAAGMIDAEDLVEDIRLACVDLDLELVRDDQPRDGLWVLVCEDDHGARVTFRVQERTETLTRMTIRFGWFGDAATARLLLNRVIHVAEGAPIEDG